jgi:hypothetical protein
VIPEIDVPGHAYSWGLGYPNLTASCPLWPHVGNINNIPLDPTADFTWSVLGTVLIQLSDQFNDAYVHLGGDEVVYGCWENDPTIVEWMQKNGFGSDFSKLFQYFVEKVGAVARATNRTVVHWIDVFDVQFFFDRNLHTRMPLVSHACWLEASKRVTNGISLGCPRFLPVGTVNCVQTLGQYYGRSEHGLPGVEERY